MHIYVWPDYEWCEEEDIIDCSWKSDDYMLLEVPEDVEDVDAWLLQTKPQG